MLFNYLQCWPNYKLAMIQRLMFAGYSIQIVLFVIFKTFYY